MVAAPSSEVLVALQERIQSGFDPSLLHKDYRSGWSPSNSSYGFCSVASEVAWFMLGGKEAGWTAWHARDVDGTTHWWLQHQDGTLFDPTADQFTSIGKLPPYERNLTGRPGGFMGIRVDADSPWPGARRPSQRAQALMHRMGVVPGEIIVSVSAQNRGARMKP